VNWISWAEIIMTGLIKSRLWRDHRKCLIRFRTVAIISDAIQWISVKCNILSSFSTFRKMRIWALCIPKTTITRVLRKLFHEKRFRRFVMLTFIIYNGSEKNCCLCIFFVSFGFRQSVFLSFIINIPKCFTLIGHPPGIAIYFHLLAIYFTCNNVFIYF